MVLSIDVAKSSVYSCTCKKCNSTRYIHITIPKERVNTTTSEGRSTSISIEAYNYGNDYALVTYIRGFEANITNVKHSYLWSSIEFEVTKFRDIDISTKSSGTLKENIVRCNCNGSSICIGMYFDLDGFYPKHYLDTSMFNGVAHITVTDIPDSITSNTIYN